MFTGLVEQCGTVIHQVPNATGTRLLIEADIDTPVIGESIAINGVCLTLLPAPSGQLAFDVSPETLRVTGLGALKAGDGVHLERALRVSDRLGGHYVNGHVDMMAKIQAVIPQGECVCVEIMGFNASHQRYLCPKGSVTLDGVSLTINSVMASEAGSEHTISVMLVPHTLSKTMLSTWHKGQSINVEFDYIARVLVHQLGSLEDSTIMSLFKQPSAGIEVSL